MEQAFFNASQFHQWLKRIHVEKNREQQSELYSKLSDHLSITLQKLVQYFYSRNVIFNH